MHAGKLVFAQVMEFAPWKTFSRLVSKFGGDANVRTFRCMDQFLCMSFAQLTYRESLRDIEACLGAQPTKLYHLGIRGNVTRSNLADANESRDWRIYENFAYALIRIARRLYASAAERGNAAAALSLGRLYDPAFLGRSVLGGVDPDPALARQWYQRAADMGDQDAAPLLQALTAR